MILNLKEYLTVPEVARKLALSEETIRRQVRSGRLKAEKIGNQWFIHEDNLSGFTCTRRSQGARNME